MFCDRCELFWDGALEKAQVPEEIKRPEDIIWAPHELVLHTSLRELKKSSDNCCRICRLVYHSPSEYEHAVLLKDHDEKLRVVLSLRAAHRPLPILQAEFREELNDTLRVPKGLVASGISDLYAEERSHQSVEEFTVMLDEAMKLDNDTTGSDGTLQLASYWIKTCVDTHEECRSKNSARSPSFMPTRLLDISGNRVRLVESESEIGKTTTERPYVALSHCWGLNPIIRTVKDNYKQHTMVIPWEKLSRTFGDAIHATRKLGFRYIWIDSLCIIQDDKDDWTAEAAVMCNVYQHAMLTIAAVHAPDGDVGCFFNRDGLMKLPFYVNLSTRTQSVTSIKLYFMTHGRRHCEELNPVLYGRAWTLQEQLLSPRLLMFEGDQLAWECLTMYRVETSPKARPSRSPPWYGLVRSAVMKGRDFFADTNSRRIENPNFDVGSTLFWCRIVMDYTHRGMTKSSDRLAALAGIGQALSQDSKHNYMAGLWSNHLFIGLLWSISLRFKHIMRAENSFNVEQNPHTRHKESIAPSWSWASVTVPVMYDEYIKYNDCICEVSNPQVFGSIDIQAGHVTIHGHVRTGYVNAIYSYSNREAFTTFPSMTARAPETHDPRYGLMNWRDRCFRPNEFFLFSDHHPDPNTSLSPDQLRQKGPFRFVRSSYCPDELISPEQEITFLAIGQRYGLISKPSSQLRIVEHGPVSVHTLALVPTGDAEGTYRRVGLAVWEDCGWYGYFCGWKDDRGGRINAWWERSPEHCVGEYFWEKAYRKYWWDDLELYRPTERVGGDGEDGRWKHQHEYQTEQLPDLRMYKKGIMVQEKTVVIV